MAMNGLHILLMVLAVNACVLGIAFFALYLLNKAVRPCGR
jgi:hypothetical protein